MRPVFRPTEVRQTAGVAVDTRPEAAGPIRPGHANGRSTRKCKSALKPVMPRRQRSHTACRTRRARPPGACRSEVPVRKDRGSLANACRKARVQHFDDVEAPNRGTSSPRAGAASPSFTGETDDFARREQAAHLRCSAWKDRRGGGAQKVALPLPGSQVNAEALRFGCARSLVRHGARGA